MKNLRIGILDMYNGTEGEGLRCINNILTSFGESFDVIIHISYFDLRQKLQMPVLFDFDGFISTGGPGSPILENNEWEKKYFSFIEELILFNKKNNTKKYLFAICHSFQLLYQYFDLGVINKRHRAMFGIVPLKPNQAGLADPYFHFLDYPFWVVDSREYQAIQPNMERFEAVGAKVLCLEKERPLVELERAVMAVRFTKEIFGTQFHPEADVEGMHRLFNKPEKKKLVISNHGLEKYETMVEYISDPEKIEKTESLILPNFLEDLLTKKYQTIS